MKNDVTPEELHDDATREFKKLLEQWQQAEKEGDVQGTSAITMAILAHAVQQAEDNPDEVSLLRDEAREHLERCEWQQAEQTYNALLERYKHDKDMEKGAANAWRTWQDLGFLYTIRERDEKVVYAVRQAIDAARHSDFLVFHLQALAQQAQIELRIGNVAQAQAAVQAAESLLELLEKEESTAYNVPKARISIAKAECLLVLKQMNKAEDELQKAWQILQPRFGDFSAGGIHNALARWWAITAQVRAARGDLQGAVSAWHESVDRRRHLALLPHIAGVQAQFYLADTLKHLAAAARETDQLENAQAAQNEAFAILHSLKLG